MGKSGDKEIVEMVIDQVFSDQAGIVGEVILREKGGDIKLPVAVDFKCVMFLTEKPADAILPVSSRYELIGELIHKLGGQVISAVIDDPDDDYYLTKLYVRSRYGYDLVLDFESGDAIAICHFFKVPIYATKKLLLKISSHPWDSEDDGRSDQPEKEKGTTAMPSAFAGFNQEIKGLDDFGKK